MSLPLHLTVEVKEGRIVRSSIAHSARDPEISITGHPTQEETKKLFAYFDAYLARKPMPPPLPLNMLGVTPFSSKVLKALSAIPYGETRTYQYIALQAGSARAYRAVGGACGRNPLPLLIPCHRVVGAQSIGGFTPPITLKQCLLSFEEGR